MAQTRPAPRSTAATAWIFLQAIVARPSLEAARCRRARDPSGIERRGRIAAAVAAAAVDRSGADRYGCERSGNCGFARDRHDRSTGLARQRPVRVWRRVVCAGGARAGESHAPADPRAALRDCVTGAAATSDRPVRLVVRRQSTLDRSGPRTHTRNRSRQRFCVSGSVVRSRVLVVSAVYVAVAFRLSAPLTLLVAAIGGAPAVAGSSPDHPVG